MLEGPWEVLPEIHSHYLLTPLLRCSHRPRPTNRSEEMDEAAMMADPMAGMPGHKPQGQTPKPDYKRFQRTLAEKCIVRIELNIDVI